MLKKLLAVIIICLFIGLSIVPANGNIVEDTYDFDMKEIITPSNCNKKFYAVDAGANMMVWFDPCIPGIFNNIVQFPSTQFPIGGAFAGDDWWVCDITGNLWIIDPISGASTSVGNSGTGELIDIEYDPYVNTMWGISTSNFYIIDMLTGAATFVGGPSVNISDIATDKYGNMWGIGGDFQSYNLYSINTSTWNVTIIGEAGMPGYYDLSYEKDEEIMWICAFNYNTFMGELWTIDPATAYMTFIGTFQGGAQTTCLAIPYDYNWSNQRPIAKFNWTPKIPSPGKTILFNASDSYDPDGNITKYEWDWDNNGVYDESHSIPTATYSWPVEGHYPVALRVTDDKGLKSERIIKTVIVDNNPPDVPTIDGPTNGGKGIEYEYIFHAMEPNGDDVFYYIDWGDKTYSGWIGPYANCTNVTVSHTWDKRGTYRIGCLAKDSHNYQGEWGYLEVSMPKNKNLLYLQGLRKFSIQQNILDILGVYQC